MEMDGALTVLGCTHSGFMYLDTIINSSLYGVCSV